MRNTRYLKGKVILGIHRERTFRFSFGDDHYIYCKYTIRKNLERGEMADAKKTRGRGELRANSQREEEPFSSLALISFA